MFANGTHVINILKVNFSINDIFDILFNVILVLKLLFGVTFKECLCGVTMEYSVHRYVIKLKTKFFILYIVCIINRI